MVGEGGGDTDFLELPKPPGTDEPLLVRTGDCVGLHSGDCAGELSPDDPGDEWEYSSPSSSSLISP